MAFKQMKSLKIGPFSGIFFSTGLENYEPILRLSFQSSERNSLRNFPILLVTTCI